MYEIGDVVIDRTYNKNGVLAIVVGTGITQPILLYHNRGIFYDELGDGFSTWDGLEMVGHIDFEKVWKEAVRIADRKTENSSEKPNNSIISKMEQVEDEFKQFDREDLILLIECQKERIAELLADKDTPQTDEEITKNSLRTDCNGCKFVGWYDTDFPCVNCIRKNKDYYTSEQTEREGE